MHFTGQGLGTNSLLAQSDQFSKVTSKSASSHCPDEPNSLNTNEFSAVMAQQGADERVASASKSDAANSDGLTADVPPDTALQAALSSSAQADVNQQVDISGNLLPGSGAFLPTGFNPGQVTADQLPEGFSGAMTASGRGAGETQGVAGDDASLSGAVWAVDVAQVKVTDSKADNAAAMVSVKAAGIADGQAARAIDPTTGLSTSVPMDADTALTGTPLSPASQVSVGGGRRIDTAAPQGTDSEVLRAPSSAPGSTSAAVALNSSSYTASQLVATATTTEPQQAVNASAQLTLGQTNKAMIDAMAMASGRKPALAMQANAIAAMMDTDDGIPAQLTAGSLTAPGPLMAGGSATSDSVLLANVPVTVGKPGWSDAIMQRVMWMSSQNINRVDIQLDPPELGPLQVRIATQADQTSVTFSSNHGAVREALDQGLPRLREMMDSQGLALADVNVSDQHARGDHQESADNSGGGSQRDNYGSSGQASENDVADAPLAVGSLSLIDQYV